MNNSLLYNSTLCQGSAVADLVFLLADPNADTPGRDRVQQKANRLLGWVKVTTKAGGY